MPAARTAIAIAAVAGFGVIGGGAIAANHQIRASITDEVEQARHALEASPYVTVRELRYEHGLLRTGAIHYDLAIAPPPDSTVAAVLDELGHGTDSVSLRGEMTVRHGPYVPGEGFVLAVIDERREAPGELRRYLPDLPEGEAIATFKGVIDYAGELRANVRFAPYAGRLEAAHESPMALMVDGFGLDYVARRIDRDGVLSGGMERFSLESDLSTVDVRSVGIESSLALMPSGRWWALDSDIRVDRFTVQVPGDDDATVDGLYFASAIAEAQRPALAAGEARSIAMTTEMGFRRLVAAGEGIGETRISGRLERLGVAALEAVPDYYERAAEAQYRDGAPVGPEHWIPLIDAFLEHGPAIESMSVSSRLDTGGSVNLSMSAALPAGLSLAAGELNGLAEGGRADAHFSADADAVRRIAEMTLTRQNKGVAPSEKQLDQYLDEIRLGIALIPFVWFDSNGGLVAEAWIRDGWVGAGDQRLMPLETLRQWQGL